MEPCGRHPPPSLEPQDKTQTGQCNGTDLGMGWGTRGPDELEPSSGTCLATPPPHPWMMGKGAQHLVPPSHLPQFSLAHSPSLPGKGPFSPRVLCGPPGCCFLFQCLKTVPALPPIPSYGPPTLAPPGEGILCPVPCFVIPHLSLLQILALALFPRPSSPSCS